MLRWGTRLGGSRRTRAKRTALRLRGRPAEKQDGAGAMLGLGQLLDSSGNKQSHMPLMSKRMKPNARAEATNRRTRPRSRLRME